MSMNPFARFLPVPASAIVRNRRKLQLQVTQLEPRIAMASGNPSGGGTSGPPTTTFGPGIGYQFTNWPIDALKGFTYTPSNTQPIVSPRSQSIRAGDWIVRDPFAIKNMDGSLAKIKGWYVMAGLATPRNDTIGTLREFSYIISRDGVNWIEGGTLLSTGTPGGLGDQLFSGDMVYDRAKNLLRVFYTPVQGSNPSEYVQSPSGKNMRQEIAVATFRPVGNRSGLRFIDFQQYGIKLRPDGQWYATPEKANTETEVYGFRDPFFFRDPKSGKSYLIFCANWGSDQSVGVGSTGDQKFPDAGPHNVDPTLPRNDAVVGIAVATDNTLTNWKLLPPIFGAIGVNEQLELPHVIYQNNRYYMFTASHDRTFIGDLKYQYPEALYGFVADSLNGPWRPLNGNGLVIANPQQDALQNYGWKAISIGRKRVEVVSFINKGNSGTISPGIVLTLKGDTAKITALQPQNIGGQGRTNRNRVPLQFGVTPTLAPGSSVPSGPNALRKKAAVVGIATPKLVARKAKPGKLTIALA